MARRKVVVGNWKMFKTVPETVAFALAWKKVADRFAAVDVGFAPPFVSLGALAEKLRGSGAWIAGQNCHWESTGAYTGEVSAPMLAAAGATSVLVGHSERRALFGETDEGCARKLVAALAADLTPILCVGETLAERKADRTFEVVDRQVKDGLAKLDPERIGRVVVAYEPVWAIGTGETATPAQAQEVHARIRELLRAIAGKPVGESVRIQYGGSVKPANARELMSQPDVDGALVGGASLEVESFAAICGAAG